MSTPNSFRPRCLCLDLETSVGPDTRLQSSARGAPDTDQSAAFQGHFTDQAVRAKLDALAQTAGFLLGHDLPILRQLHPDHI